MRWFFLSLLLSNVAFLGWQIWFAAPVTSEHQIHARMQPEHGLALLSELPVEQRPGLREAAGSANGGAPASDAVPSAQPSVPATPIDAVADLPVAAETPTKDAEKPAETIMLCYQSDEYNSAAELDGVEKALKGYGISEVGRDKYMGEKNSYWVMLPPYRSLAKADEAVKLLQARRVKDFFIVRSGQYENAVSLGVYTTKERAQRRADEISALKLRLREPSIELRKSDSERHLLRFSLPQDEAAGILAKLGKRYPDTSYSKISCK